MEMEILPHDDPVPIISLRQACQGDGKLFGLITQAGVPTVIGELGEVPLGTVGGAFCL